jgi:hypothetical protein
MIRFEGSFVTRVQLAKVGEPMQERSENEMGDYWGNQPVVANNQREVKLGDATEADRTEENAPRSAPTLRKPGEQLPADNDKDHPVGAMQPVNMPPDQRRPGDPGYTPTVSAKQPQCSGQGIRPRFESGFAPDRFDANFGPVLGLRLCIGLYAVCPAAEWNFGFLATAVRLREQLPAEERLKRRPSSPKVDPLRIDPTRSTNHSSPAKSEPKSSEHRAGASCSSLARPSLGQLAVPWLKTIGILGK